MLLAVAAALLLCGAHRHKAKRRLDPPPVTPSAEIEARVSAEVRKAEITLRTLDADRLFDSPFLASAVYYHEGFLSSFPAEKEDADPSRRIIAAVIRLMTPALKERYLALLNQRYAALVSQASDGRLCLPVAWEPPSNRRRRRRPVHPHAIDLFAPEGSPVRAASRGVVILAESGWAAGDPFSTSSRLGGNTLIVADPTGQRMYRYCHLDSVLVSAGEVVQTGETIGTVGHSGMNASRPRHGGHLHFEVNDYGGGAVRALDYKELLALLKGAWSAGPGTSSGGGR